MHSIQVSYIFHRYERRIRLQFDNYGPLNDLVKRTAGARWSKSHKSWHIPCDPLLYKDFKSKLPANVLLTELKERGLSPSKITGKEEAKNNIASASQKQLPAKIIKPAIHPVNQAALQQYIDQLQLKAYSSSSIKTYRNEFSAFLQVLKNRDVSTLSADEIKRYILYCINTLHLSENSIHSKLNALYPVGSKKNN